MTEELHSEMCLGVRNILFPEDDDDNGKKAGLTAFYS